MQSILEKYDVFVFDCDSTLTKVEGIDELGRMKNLEKEISDLTKLAMDGKLSFDEVLSKRLDLIKPTEKDLSKISDLYVRNIVKGAEELVSILNNSKKEVFIVSWGYAIPVKALADFLNIKKTNAFAVDLKFDLNGHYIEYEKATLAASGGKLGIVRHIKSLTNNKPMVFIGDSIADLEVKPAVDLFVGFGGVIERPALKEKADFYVTSLLDILKLPLANTIQEKQSL